ncbi:MAG: DUF998 domain-containing protein [Minisyncoccia bacterium]
MADSLRLIFSGITVIGALAFFGLIILLHFLPNRYNPIKNTVSDYAIAPSGKPHAYLAVAMPLMGAISSLSLAIAIVAGINTASISVILFLLIASIFRFLLVLFPTDITGQPATKIGRIHLAFAVVAFAGIAFAAGNFHMTAVDETVGRAVIFAAILLLFGFLPPLKKIFGLLERIFLLSSVIWLVVAGLELFLKR